MGRPGWLAGKRTIVLIALATLLAGSIGYVLTRHAPDPRTVVLEDPTDLPTTPPDAWDPNGNPIVTPSPAEQDVPAPTPVETPDPKPHGGPSGEGIISANGRYVAFTSFASNLTPGDDNQARDVFWRDRVEKRTILVSRSTSGDPFENASSIADLSGNGQVVAYFAHEGKTPPKRGWFRVSHLYVNDVSAHRTRRVTTPGHPSVVRLSYDGRYAAMSVDDSPGSVWEVDTTTGESIRVSQSSSGTPAKEYAEISGISSDGRKVAFSTRASDQVPDDTNEKSDVFVHDRITGTTERVSLTMDGKEADGTSIGGQLSSDGRLVGFMSDAGNITPELGCGDQWTVYALYVRGRETGSIATPPEGPFKCVDGLSMSGDGMRFVNAATEFGTRWLWDRSTDKVSFLFYCNTDQDTVGTPVVYPVGEAWPTGSSTISGSGSFMVSSTNCSFSSEDRNKTTDVYVRDLGSGDDELVSVPDGA